jgi:hypothetical protein
MAVGEEVRRRWVNKVITITIGRNRSLRGHLRKRKKEVRQPTSGTLLRYYRYSGIFPFAFAWHSDSEEGSDCKTNRLSSIAKIPGISSMA